MSGKWNPFIEASHESSFKKDGDGEMNRKQFDRRRRRSEVMSFDGDILR